MFAVMRRQDGGSPCGASGGRALPAVAASCDPPADRDTLSVWRWLGMGLGLAGQDERETAGLVHLDREPVAA